MGGPCRIHRGAPVVGSAALLPLPGRGWAPTRRSLFVAPAAPAPAAFAASAGGGGRRRDIRGCAGQGGKRRAPRASQPRAARAAVRVGTARERSDLASERRDTRGTAVPDPARQGREGTPGTDF